MFRQACTVGLAAVVGLGSLARVTAQESKEAGGKTKSSLRELAVDLGGGVKLQMVLIPAGEFLMGSPDAGENAKSNETPQHRVRITRPFYLGKYLVTQEQWEAVMGSNPSRFKNPKNPVENVSWADCQRFLEKLHKIDRQEGRFLLPSEAQWEYACRAGARPAFALGTIGAGWASTHGMTPTRRPQRTRLARRNQTPGGCTTCTGMYGSGAHLGTTAGTMPIRG